MFGIIDRGAFLEDNAADVAISKHFLRSPTWVDDHAVFASLFALFKRCRHDVFGLQRQHCYRCRATAFGHTGSIDGHVAAANDYYVACDLHLAAVGVVQEVDSGDGARECFTRDAGQFASLAADGHIETLVALFAELFYGDVLADLHARANLHTDLAHDVDFGLDDVLIQFVGRNTVA